MKRSDHELWQASCAGDEAAFAQLVQRHTPMLRSVVRQMLRMEVRDIGEDMVADLVQITWIRASQHLHEINGASVGGWVRRIVSNATLDYLKSVRQRGMMRSTMDGLIDVDAFAPEKTPDLVEDAEWLRQQLYGPSALLSREQQEPLRLLVEGYSYEQMAEHLGITQGALKMRVHRAREILRPAYKVRFCA